MSNPTITGRHKFEHRVGGYPQYQPPAQGSLDDLFWPGTQEALNASSEYFAWLADYAPAPATQEMTGAFRVSKVLREALADYYASPDTEDAPRPRYLALDLDQVMAGGDPVTRRIWASVLRQNRDTALPIVVSCSRADIELIPAPGIKANLEARLRLGAL